MTAPEAQVQAVDDAKLTEASSDTTALKTPAEAQTSTEESKQEET